MLDTTRGVPQDDRARMRALENHMRSKKIAKDMAKRGLGWEDIYVDRRRSRWPLSETDCKLIVANYGGKRGGPGR